MSTLSALRDWLLADTAIAAIVDDRVLVQVAPTGYASPYIRITPVSTLPEQCHDAALAEAEDGVRAQLDIYADTLADCDELQPLVRARVLLIGTIPICDYTEPHDQTTGRWRRTIDLIFSPNDLEADAPPPGGDWAIFTEMCFYAAMDQTSGSEPNAAAANPGSPTEFVAFNSPGYDATGGPGGIPCRTSSGANEYFRATGITNLAADDLTILIWSCWSTVTQPYNYAMISSGYELGIGQPSTSNGNLYAGSSTTFVSAQNAWHCTILRYQKSTKRAEIFVDGVSKLDITLGSEIAAVTDMHLMYLPGLSSDTLKLARLFASRTRATDADIEWLSASARTYAEIEAHSP